MRILYVEDSPVDADLTARELARSAPELQLHVVDRVDAALQVLRSDEPAVDLVLTDLRLPDGSGLELVAAQRRGARSVPVVVVTGAGDEHTVVAALRAGASDYVLKTGDYLHRLPATLSSAVRQFGRMREQRGRSILVLQAEADERDAARTQRHLAERAPHLRLRRAADAATVLRQLDPGGVEPAADLLLLVDPLPGMGALDLIKEIRQQRGLELPLVLVTEHASEQMALDALQLGADDYLVKGADFLGRLPVTLENAELRARLVREQAALQESEMRFRELAENIDQVFWLASADRSQFLYVSPAFEHLWGQARARLYDAPQTWFDAIHEEDRAAARAGGAVAYRVQRPDGSLRYVEERSFPVRDRAGRPYRVAGIVRDVTEHKAQEARIDYLAYHDALTGLANRTLVLNRLALAVARAERSERTLAVLLVDLDRFSAVNDTFGHAAGDQVLVQAGERLRQLLREEDTVGRGGSDEFLVLLPDLDGAEQAAQVADKILAAFEAPFLVQRQELHLGVSIGVSLCPRDAGDGPVLLKYADTAMHRGKEQQRNCFRFFSPELDTRVRARLQLESELRRAVQGGQLALVYQPQVDLTSGAIIGAEALVRWNHPQRGVVMPGEFIPMAEETGLIVALGDWVLEAASRQARSWNDAGWHGLRIAVNVSGRQIEHTDLLATLQRVLQRTGCPAACLEIEITESTVMRDPRRAIELVLGAQGRGIRVAMDDFGTGYSSLAQLKNFRVDRLKIDSSFVRGLPGDEDDVAIVQSIILLARQLRLEVVAEGVETPAQRDFLRALGCQAMQGYLFSRPVAAAAFEALLQAGGAPAAPPA